MPTIPKVQLTASQERAGRERLAVIKAEATRRRTTMADVARLAGVSYNHFMLVVRGFRLGSARVRKAIADFVGMPSDKYWA